MARPRGSWEWNVAIARKLLRIFGSAESVRYAILAATIVTLVVWEWAVVRFRLYGGTLFVTLVLAWFVVLAFKDVRDRRGGG